MSIFFAPYLLFFAVVFLQQVVVFMRRFQSTGKADCSIDLYKQRNLAEFHDEPAGRGLQHIPNASDSEPS